MPLNEAAPAFGKRKAVLYATCFVNFHNTGIGVAARAVLAKNGVETVSLHPACCGMPKLELGDLQAVSDAAHKVSAELLPWVDKGYDIIALTPSCALMLKFEWPLILGKNPAIERLARATFDISEYVVDIAKKEGAKCILGGGPAPDLPGGQFVEPTIFTDVKPEMRIAREEVFGPVACVYRVPDEDAAISLANATPFGLGASVWTDDADAADRCISQLDAGMIFVNDMVVSDPRYPFGGVKQSGIGRELGPIGFREFTNPQTIRRLRRR